MKYYKLFLFILILIIILTLLYNHIYVNEKFSNFLYNKENQSEDTIINHIILNELSSNVPSTSPIIPTNNNLLNCIGPVCLTNLRFNSEYPTS